MKQSETMRDNETNFKANEKVELDFAKNNESLDTSGEFDYNE